jgi:hypothetical protein
MPAHLQATRRAQEQRPGSAKTRNRNSGSFEPILDDDRLDAASKRLRWRFSELHASCRASRRRNKVGEPGRTFEEAHGLARDRPQPPCQHAVVRMSRDMGVNDGFRPI